MYNAPYNSPIQYMTHLVRKIHGIAIHVSYNDCIEPEDGFYSRNKLLTVN